MTAIAKIFKLFLLNMYVINNELDHVTGLKKKKKKNSDFFVKGWILKVWWPYATLFAFIFLYTIQ